MTDGEGAQADSADEAAPRVDFYVIEDPSGSARLKLACRLAEKAYLAAHRVLIWHTAADELKTLDDLLWIFSDRSFVPHEMAREEAASEAPVVLAAGRPPPGEVDLIINLSPDPPPGVQQMRAGSKPHRIIEIIDGDETRRRTGRARWTAYRELGLAITPHNLDKDGAQERRRARGSPDGPIGV